MPHSYQYTSVISVDGATLYSMLTVRVSPRRQKKFRKSKGRADSRGNDGESRPQSQPPAAMPPPLPKAHPGLQTGTISQPDGWEKATFYHSSADAPEDPPLRAGQDGREGAYSSQMGSGDICPPSLDPPGEARRPATRGSECGGGSGAAEFGSEEMPMLPNLQRPARAGDLTRRHHFFKKRSLYSILGL